MQANISFGLFRLSSVPLVPFTWFGAGEVELFPWHTYIHPHTWYAKWSHSHVYDQDIRWLNHVAAYSLKLAMRTWAIWHQRNDGSALAHHRIVSNSIRMQKSKRAKVRIKYEQYFRSSLANGVRKSRRQRWVDIVVTKFFLHCHRHWHRHIFLLSSNPISIRIWFANMSEVGKRICSHSGCDWCEEWRWIPLNELGCFRFSCCSKYKISFKWIYSAFKYIATH